MESYLPSVNLRPYIKVYRIIESDHDFENMILPDTSIVMAIRFKGTVTGRENGFEYTLPQVVLSGLRHAPRVVRYASGSGNVLVVFHPGGTAAFVEEPLHELAGLSVAIDFFKNLADVKQISEGVCRNAERIRRLDHFLASKLKGTLADALVLQAAQQIKSSHGSTPIKSLLDTFSISRDAFEKRFRQTIGTSPKQFSNIVRIRSIIDQGQGHRTLTEVAYDHGYFDQSHFIRDFKLFTGQTPSHFFKAPRFW